MTTSHDLKRLLYLRVSRLKYDDTLTSAGYTLVYHQFVGKRIRPGYTLYDGGRVVKRWAVNYKTAMRALWNGITHECARRSACEWTRCEYGALLFAPLGAPPRDVPVVQVDFAPRVQLRLEMAG